MQPIGTLLAEHPFFAGLGRCELDLIAGCARNVRFEPGEHVFREGGAADSFYVIRFGRVVTEIRSPGRGPIAIQTLGEGEVLGWSWLFPPYRWFHDARAVELVRAVAFDGTCLRGKCESDPRLGYELMKRFAQVIIERLENTRMQLLDVYGNAAAHL
jgi:CRP-like cAMP-binding protein